MQWLLDILRGAVIGISNIIPGVSGGTMAVSMGIYDRLIGDINGLLKRFRKSVIDVLPIGIGILVGIFAFSALIGGLLGVSIPWDADLSHAKAPLTQKRLTAMDVLNEGLSDIQLTHGDDSAVLTHLNGSSWKLVYQDGTEKTLSSSALKFKRVNDGYQLELSPVRPPLTKMPTIFAFIGLILGGLGVIFRRIKVSEFKAGGWVLFILFFALVVVLPLLRAPGAQSAGNSFGSILLMMLLGGVASATMVIPGVSGSMILMLLGYYEAVIGALNSLRGGDFSALVLLLPFGIGIVIGLFLIAKLISTLLEKAPVLTFAAILGLVLASPVALLIQNSECFGVATAANWLVSLLCLVGGAVVAWLLSRLDSKPQSTEG